MSSFGFIKRFCNITVNATSMMLRIPGTLCPYRRVRKCPAVIYARLGTYRIDRVEEKAAAGGRNRWQGTIIGGRRLYLAAGGCTKETSA
jgi:hypothetical protein